MRRIPYAPIGLLQELNTKAMAAKLSQKVRDEASSMHEARVCVCVGERIIGTIRTPDLCLSKSVDYVDPLDQRCLVTLCDMNAHSCAGHYGGHLAMCGCGSLKCD